ncbi:MAG: 6-phospho-3-hexuloisomerase, partial [Methanosarcina sp.]
MRNQLNTFWRTYMKKDQVNDCEDVILSMELMVDNLNEVVEMLDRQAIISMLQ